MESWIDLDNNFLDRYQTAFVQGRLLMESFLSAREFLNFCFKRKLPAVLYKVDFEKAFDTVDWCYLVNLLIERGFPPGLAIIDAEYLWTSESAIKINGVHTRFFVHKRGLRQGDPLSPMIFILVADSLGAFLRNAACIMPPHAALSPHTIQYADDTLIICEAHPTTLKIVTRILKVYTELSDLQINISKSNFVPLSVQQNLVIAIQRILASPPLQLPMTYLGLPLTVKTPRKVDFQPMLDAVQRRIEGWTSNFLSYGGRVTLVKAVLSAMPLHYMQAFSLPVGVIKHIDKMRRNFL